MTRKLINLLIALSLLATTALVAETPEPRERRARTETFIIRDGKVVSTDGEPFFVGGKRAFLGVGLVDLTPALREHYGAPKDAGALVGSVEAGTPAEKAGIRVGDLVISVDGKDVASAGDLRRALAEKKEGDSVRIDVLRNGKRQTLVASVIERESNVFHFRAPAGEELRALEERLRSPEWRARIERLPCGDLQTRIKELETRLKDLEKKLQK